MKISSGILILSFVILISAVHSHDDRHNHHRDQNWISILSGLGIFIKNKTAISVTTSLENASDMQDKHTSTTAELEMISVTSENSSIPEIMDGSTYDSGDSNRSVVIGVPIGGIIVLVILIYCCYKCCCARCGNDVVVQQTVVQQHIPQQPPAQPTQIVVQQIQQPPMPQQQYPGGYEMRQPWQQQPPMNQQFQNYPPPPQYHPGTGQHNPGFEPTAPPNYGKY